MTSRVARSFRSTSRHRSARRAPFGSFALLFGAAACATPSSDVGQGVSGGGGSSSGTSGSASSTASMTAAGDGGGLSTTDAGAPATNGDAGSGEPSPPAGDAAAMPDASPADGQSADVGDGGGCPGVPIVPDSTGFVAPGSNSVGIHGSWFVYSDCVDLKGKNCSVVASPPANSFPNVGGKMCTSGQTSSAAGAWGAGIGLELSDGPPQQPYDTTAHNVIGFCFELSGATIPSTTIRVAFPTQDNNDNAYFEAVNSPGMHTILFSDIAQGSWVTSKAAFEPTKVMLMQLQIPSSTVAPVPWDFCIEGVTAITD